MDNLSPQAEALLADFANRPGVTPDQTSNLRAAITSSPFVVNEVNQGVQEGHLKTFQPLTDPHAAGEFNDRRQVDAVQIPLHVLTKGERMETTLTIGHEVRHALNYDARQNDYRAFRENVTQALTGASPHDLTPAFDKFLAGRRVDEATAQIAGYNAVVSALQEQHAKNHTKLELSEIFKSDRERMGDFIHHGNEGYTLNLGLTAHSDLSLPATPGNIETVAKSFYDRSQGMGPKGNSGYQDLYGSWAVGEAARLDRFYRPDELTSPVPNISLDMAKLGLDRKTMEGNGIDLGGNTLPLPYYDISHGRQVASEFTHTGTSPDQLPLAPRLDDPAHPGNEMFKQAQTQVYALDAQHGRTPDQRSENLAGAVTTAALAGGIRRIDFVLPDIKDGSTMFVAENTSPLKTIAQVPTVQAMNTPLEQSSTQYLQVAQQQAQTQAQTQVQVQAQAQAQPVMQMQIQPPSPQR